MAQDLRILAAVTAGNDATEQQQFLQELEAQMGLKIEMVKLGDHDNVLMTAPSSGENFCLVCGESSMLANFTAQGAIRDVIVASGATVKQHPVEWDDAEPILKKDVGKGGAVFKGSHECPADPFVVFVLFPLGPGIWLSFYKAGFLGPLGIVDVGIITRSS